MAETPTIYEERKAFQTKAMVINMQENNIIAQRLVELRNQKGIYQETIANILSVSNKTVSKWENGISEPSLSMLIKLAEYYNVSTDYILGLSNESNQSSNSFIHSSINSSEVSEIFVKAFDLIGNILPVCLDTINKRKIVETSDKPRLPYEKENESRCIVEHNNCFSYCTASNEANLAVILMRNKSNFSWLNYETTQEQLTKVFLFLSDKDALSLCYFLHNIDSPKHFTTDFIAQKLNISKEKATALLENAYNIRLCSKITAHLASGDVPLYKSSGSGNILSILTLAFEYMRKDNKKYSSSYIREIKMIGGSQS